MPRLEVPGIQPVPSPIPRANYDGTNIQSPMLNARGQEDYRAKSFGPSTESNLGSGREIQRYGNQKQVIHRRPRILIREGDELFHNGKQFYAGPPARIRCSNCRARNDCCYTQIGEGLLACANCRTRKVGCSFVH